MSSERVSMLTPDDAEAFAGLRREALLDSPLAVAASPDADLAADLGHARQQHAGAPDNAVFGAFRERLVGCVGIWRDRHIKLDHKAHVWGMYVAPTHRRHGLGAELLLAAIGHAESLRGVDWVQLSVSSASPGARRLYEGYGFCVWGTEEDAMRYEDAVTTEYHMALRLAA
jgi:ribosomal protein S18 acetylase RimI-like enzyme